MALPAQRWMKMVSKHESDLGEFHKVVSEVREIELFVRDIQFDSPKLPGDGSENHVDVTTFFVLADGINDVGLKFNRFAFDSCLDKTSSVNLVSFATQRERTWLLQSRPFALR